MPFEAADRPPAGADLEWKGYSGMAWKDFVRREDGTATVESVIWLPIFFVILVMIADASLLFNSQARMLRMVQDANRAYSTGQLDQPADVENFLVAQMFPMSEHVRATSVLDTSAIPAGVIDTTLTIPARDLVSIGLVTALTNFDMSVNARHYREF